MEIYTKSTKETKDFSARFSASLKGGEILALQGDLGSGKTTFVQGLARGFGIKAQINSPTFILMRQYEIGSKKLFHLDLYRLEEDIDPQVRALGIEEFWGKEDNVVVVEWADKAAEIFPEGTIWIYFENVDENTRKITIQK